MIDVQVRYTKKALADPAALAQLRQPMVLGQALAKRVRERVSRQGDLATEWQRYRTEVKAERAVRRLEKNYDTYERRIGLAVAQGNLKRAAELRAKLAKIDNDQQDAGDKLQPYVISDAYAKLLGLGATRWSSSAAFHSAAGTKPGTFRVSGGMWRGLQVRNVGASSVILDFAGSSLGGTRQSSTTKSGRQRKSPVQVRNQVKAGTVFRQSKVNPIQPKDIEVDAMVSAVVRWSQNMMGRTLGATVGAFQGSGDQQLMRDILAHYDGSR